MSLGTGVGAEGNLLDETPEHAHQLVMDQPILRNQELETLRRVSTTTSSRRTRSTSRGRSPRAPAGMQKRLAERSATRPTTRSRPGVNVLILSDRAVGPEARADPVAARRRRRSTTTSCARARACGPGLVLESGEPREVHHFATLIGYGASAINPYVCSTRSTS